MQPLVQAKSAKHSALPWQSHQVDAHSVAMQPVQGSLNDGHTISSPPAPALVTTALPTAPPTPEVEAAGPTWLASLVEPPPAPPCPLPPSLACTKTWEQATTVTTREASQVGAEFTA